MKTNVTRDQALSLLMKYNKESFHILHGLTVEGTMRWYAKELGYGEDEDFWGSPASSRCGFLKIIRRSTAQGAGTSGRDPGQNRSLFTRL